MCIRDSLKSDRNVLKAKELLYLGLPVKQKSGLDSSTTGAANWWEFELNQFGRRAIMNDITAAIGVCQMNKLPGFLERRKEIYQRYNNELGQCDFLKLPPELSAELESSYYFYWVQTENRDALAQHLLDNDIYSTFRYWPLHKVSAFASCADIKLDNSDYIASRTLNIPLHHSLTDENVNLIIETIKRFQV